MPSLVSARIPFFLVYDSRSGSTLLANLMVRHLGVVVPPEARFVIQIIKQFKSRRLSHGLIDRVLNTMYGDEKFLDWQLEQPMLADRLHGASPLTAADIIIETGSMYRDFHYPRNRVLGFKKGEYIYRRDLVKSVFPRAKFVAIVRDGRAVFSSKKRSLYSATGQPFETSPLRAAKTWMHFCSELEAAKNEYPGDVLTVKYEELVENHVAQMETISEFLQTEFQSDGQSNYRVAERYEGLHDNALKQPIVERIDAWRTQLMESEIEEFESVAYEMLISQGYDPIMARPKQESDKGSSRTRKPFLERLAGIFAARR